MANTEQKSATFTEPAVLSIPAMQSKKWIEKIIVGLNFCPFAKKELLNQSIYYYVSKQVKLKLALIEIIEQCHYLKQHAEIETTLIIFEQGFKNFTPFLDLIDYANNLMSEQHFDGVFQLASFHPDYCFQEADFDDAANFTNRAPYPTLHLIREDSISKVLSTYNHPENIPDKNIALAREKGNKFFQQILQKISKDID